MSVAIETSKLGTCPRAAVGAVLVKGKRIISTGYNGMPRGEDHCVDVGCKMEESHCLSVHAELNAVLNAAFHGISTEGTTMYCTLEPCNKCRSFLINAGVVEVFYLKEYRSEELNIYKNLKSTKYHCTFSN